MTKPSGGSVTATRPLFQGGEGSSTLTSPHQLFIQPVTKNEAASCYRAFHYLGDTGFMSTHDFGVYFNSELVGCISYGIPNAREIKGIYSEKEMPQWFEIKRLALSDDCPKNSESRVIAITLRLIRKSCPHILGVITYADTEAGHTGIIYRAAGFEYRGLTAPKTDLFIDGVKVGKKGQYFRSEKEREEWRPRSRKHLFVKNFTNQE